MSGLSLGESVLRGFLVKQIYEKQVTLHYGRG